MALWGKTDTLADAPKWLSDDPNVMPSQDVFNAFFVDIEESQVTSNRDKGLKTPGWNLYREYTNGVGQTRRIAEPLVVMKVSAADAGDLGVFGNTEIEDSTVADS
jgi:hypothetical protein